MKPSLGVFLALLAHSLGAKHGLREVLLLDFFVLMHDWRSALLTQGMFCFRLAVIVGVLFFMGQVSALSAAQIRFYALAKKQHYNVIIAK